MGWQPERASRLMRRENINPSMKQELDTWVDSLQFKQYAAHTVSGYKRHVLAFGYFLKGRGQDSWHCQKKEVSRYFGELLEGGLDINTVKLKLSAMNQFYRFLIQKDPTLKNPLTGYRLTGGSNRLPKLIDTDLMARLLDQPAPTCQKAHSLWLRDRAMFELLYGSGLRVGELVCLQVGEVDLAARTVIVTGKGGKVRQVPVGKKSWAAILDYLPIRTLWLQDQDETALFVSTRKTPLTTRAIQLRLIACAKRAGIEQHLHPHLLRHAFASHVLSSSGNLRAVQEMLGHSNLKTTQLYTHLDFGALTSVYDKAHPRAVK